MSDRRAPTMREAAILSEAARIFEARGDYRCRACLRPEDDCSADPCEAVIHDREE